MPVHKALAATLIAVVTLVSSTAASAAGNTYFSGNGDCRDIALTYDVEFSSTTQDLIDTIDDLGIHTTWFFLGDSVDSYPDIVQQVAATHEIGNHTWDHPEMPKLSESHMRQEIRDAEASITEISGVNPRPFWRPPYGEYNSTVVRVAAEEGYPYTMLWSIDTEDWNGPSVQTIRRRIVDGAFPGAIVLQHGFPPNSIEATRLAVGDLRARGYQFVTVSEILGLDRDQRDFGGDDYTVQSGDSMAHVGACHNVTGPRLTAYNEVANPSPGTVLEVPHKNEIIVRLNGTRQSFAVYPRLVGGKSMAHVRLAERFGATVAWDGAHVIITRGSTRIELTPGERTALVNGVPQDMGGAAIMVNDRVLAPVRFLAEQLGATVAWDQETYTVLLTSN